MSELKMIDWKPSRLRLGWDSLDKERELLQTWCEKAAQAGGSFSISTEWTGKEWMVVYSITTPAVSQQAADQRSPDA